MKLTGGAISAGRKLVTFALLASIATVGLFASSAAVAAGPLAPIDNWTELAPPHAPDALYDGSSAFDQANGEMVYFGGGTYLGETNETWTWDGSDWTKESPAHRPSPRGRAAMAFDPLTGTVLLFGGDEFTTRLSDTWSWDGEDWAQLTPATSPPARSGSAMAFDAATGRMLLFGGASNGFVDDTWAWDGSDWTQLTPAHHPSARNGIAMTFDQATGEVVLFGGHTGGGGYLGDTWTWDGDDWTLETPANSPPATGFAAMDFNPALGLPVLFGGDGPGGFRDSAWAWDDGDWIELTPANRPAALRGPVMSFDPSMGDMVMTGGGTSEGTLDDTWTYGPPPGVNSNWSELSPEHRPPGLEDASMAFDQSTGEAVLFGGTDNGNASDETWVWDGSDWTRKSPAHSPPGRADAMMAFDPAHGEVVLFGGTPGAGALGDTWVWDGDDWTEKSPTNSPPALFSGTLAFDSASGDVVLFGGSNGITRHNQTWVWDGANWTQRSPVTAPPRRVGAGMAFDPASGELVMFGGFGGVNPADAHYLDDTWVWDGSDWSQKSPATKPSGRFAFSMAFDPAIGRMVLYGGATGGFTVNDTWAWDGGDWEQLTPAASPSTHAATSMTFDPSSGSMVLFGGAGSDGTWVFELEVGPPTAQITAPAGGEAFAVGEPVATAFDCAEAAGGPGVAGCEDSNGSSAPAGTLDTSTVGPHTYKVTATSENGLTGTDQIEYTVDRAKPTIAASGAEAEVMIGSNLEVDADLAGAYQPGGSLIFRAYGPGDATCSATPAFESSPVTVTDNGQYESPGFTPTEDGTYRWTVTYSGDASNQAAASDCDTPGSVTEITETPTPPPPPDKCPRARPGLKLTGFGLKPPFGKAKPVFGVRVGFNSKNAIVKFTPSMTYRLAGKRRTVKLRIRTLKVNGRRYLRFRAPDRLKKGFRKAGASIRRAPVTFTVKARIRPQGSRAECFRNLGVRKLKTRLVNVSGRVALRRLGGF